LPEFLTLMVYAQTAWIKIKCWVTWFLI